MVRKNDNVWEHRTFPFAEILATMGDAHAAAAVVRAGRLPAAHNLIRLGIDPKQFSKVRQTASQTRSNVR